MIFAPYRKNHCQKISDEVREIVTFVESGQGKVTEQLKVLQQGESD